MGRTGWIIAGVAAILAVGSVVALTTLSGDAEYKSMMGPVAIVKGPVPTNGFLGVSFDSMSGGAATVGNVMAGSGAAEAGLRTGDVIVAVGDIKDPDAAAVKRVTNRSKPGDGLPLRIRRGQEELDISVRLISFEQMLELDVAAHRDPGTSASPRATTSTTSD